MHLVLLKRRRKRKNDRTLHASSEPEMEKPPDNNDVSISDVETQSGNEHSPSDMKRIMMMFMKTLNQTMINNQIMMLK